MTAGREFSLAPLSGGTGSVDWTLSGHRWYWWHRHGRARENLGEESEKESLNLKFSDGFGEREIRLS